MNVSLHSGLRCRFERTEDIRLRKKINPATTLATEYLLTKNFSEIMASGDSQEPGLLHERLREQVTLSIRESLEKATSVLSNLHRVQSYFDVIRNISPSRGAGGGTHTTEGIKNALEQIRTIRSDAATLLQTVYLTEIGLQSLQVQLEGEKGIMNTATGFTCRIL